VVSEVKELGPAGALLLAGWGDPPGSPGRIAGALLGVLGGEEAGLAGPALGPGPVGQAMLDLANGFVASRGDLPLDVANSLAGLDSPAWLLSLAITRPNPTQRLEDTQAVAAAAGFDDVSQEAAGAYVDLASNLLHADSVEADELADAGRGALRDAGLWGILDGVPDNEEPWSPLGRPILDALAIALLTLGHDGPARHLVGSLKGRVSPGVLAAVGGLLGIRDGAQLTPWLPGREGRAACGVLVDPLHRLLHHPAVTTTLPAPLAADDVAGPDAEPAA
jgi:hypothetical protein